MVAPDTAVSDTFSTIFTLLNNNVQDITNLGGDTVELRKSNGNYWTGAFPDIDIEDQSEYPIGVISTPLMDSANTGFTRQTNTLTVNISVYGTRAEHPPKFVEKAWATLKDKRDSLQGDDLYGLTSEQSEQDVFTRGELKVHEYTLPVVVNLEDC